MSGLLRWPRLTVWQWIFVLIMAGGAAALYVRIVYGLGGSTNLTDAFPWGLWKGFNVLTGIALAAGGFTLAATVHIFNIETYKPILRPAILTAFLGYSLMVVALMIDIGLPHRIWHPVVMWNPHSVLFEVAWCVMLYSMVLALEFAPVVCEKYGWSAPQRLLRLISIPLVMFGVILSTLHQSSLGSLFLIVPYKLDALWYTPMLPVLFFISAICAGLAVLIFMSWHSSRAFGRQLPRPLLSSMGRVLAVTLAFYLVVRFVDLARRDVLELLLVNRRETWLFGAETVLLLLPMLLLFRKHVRFSPSALYGAAVLVILGFVANRLNVSVTGLETGSGAFYVPKWSEVMITLSLIAIAFAIFQWVARRFPVFPVVPAPAAERAVARVAHAPELVPAGKD